MIRVIRHSNRAKHTDRCGDSILSNYRYVGRPTLLGNPYTHLAGKTRASYVVGSAEEAVERYYQWFHNQLFANLEFQQVINELCAHYENTGELYLGCWCKDELKPSSEDHVCHTTIIRDYILQRTAITQYWNQVNATQPSE